MATIYSIIIAKSQRQRKNFKNSKRVLAIDQKIICSNPSQGTYPGFSSILVRAHTQSNQLMFLSHINVSLLKKKKAMKKISYGEDKKAARESYIQGKPHAILDRFLNKNFSRQKRMGCHIQNIERK